jgi:hypothetical protein
MAKLVRYQQCGCFHFLTFSCYRRLGLLTREGAYGVFEHELDAVRRRYMHRNPVARGLVEKPPDWPCRASGITRRVSLEWSRSNRIGLRSGEGINYQNTSVTIKRAVEVRARPPFARKEAKDGAPSSCGLGKGAPPAHIREEWGDGKSSG